MKLEGKAALVTGAGSRVCVPEDVRDAILGFVEGSDMVTGQVLVVDGGLGIAG